MRQKNSTGTARRYSRSVASFQGINHSTLPTTLTHPISKTQLIRILRPYKEGRRGSASDGERVLAFRSHRPILARKSPTSPLLPVRLVLDLAPGEEITNICILDGTNFLTQEILD